jgi:hypothetical protein
MGSVVSQSTLGAILIAGIVLLVAACLTWALMRNGEPDGKMQFLLSLISATQSGTPRRPHNESMGVKNQKAPTEER